MAHDSECVENGRLFGGSPACSAVGFASFAQAVTTLTPGAGTGSIVERGSTAAFGADEPNAAARRTSENRPTCDNIQSRTESVTAESESTSFPKSARNHFNATSLGRGRPWRLDHHREPPECRIGRCLSPIPRSFPDLLSPPDFGERRRETDISVATVA